MSPTLQADSIPAEPQGKPISYYLGKPLSNCKMSYTYICIYIFIYIQKDENKDKELDPRERRLRASHLSLT